MKTNKQKKQKGFTLIELMIVVAIIGVLSAVAIPAYKDYVKKSEVASAVATMKSLITPAELYYQENGDITTSTNLGDLGISSGSTSLGTLAPKAGQIELSLTNISGAKITITRDANAGWICDATGDAADLVTGCK